MDPSVSNYIEFSMLLIIVLMLLTSSRHVAIYGGNSATNWTFGICAVVCLMVAVYFDGKARSPIANAAGTHITVLGKDASPQEKDLAQRSIAQFRYVQTGEIANYPVASGESLRFQPTERDVDSRNDWIARSSKLEAAQQVSRVWQKIWLLTWIPVVLLGYLAGRIEYAYLVKKYQFSRVVNERSRIMKPHTFAEVEGFVGLLKAACEDPAMNSTLQTILEQPDAGRKSMIRDLLVQFKDKGAPQVLSDAFICLMDNEVAEKVYVYIHQCERPAA